MVLTVKLDEDLSSMVGEPLREAGYIVATVCGQGWGGLIDPESWPRVCEEKAYFITADKGFGDIRRYAPGSHHGILLLRADEESIVEYRMLVERVLSVYRLESLVGAITVASPRSIRVRRPEA